ncbi:winged helix-turn-helix domain-containing protein [Kribbella solani]|uniref:DNA-binding transcriptional ArsR family regulator n=1 Tax=Kribbella solani TaxID=236067 RepID=A0A841DQX9_9ACTN|nr:helix-turn-helix domain-containing protein [Kribbella solani]MBB5980321.1 DNA-binding transcriptional ArsR family regulator [Kribbella solani]
MRFVEDSEQVRLALSPIRRRLLELLREPASATQLAAALDLPRQRVNYHLRELEKAGLIELVEERRRRGLTERILRATAATLVVDPLVVDPLLGRAFTEIQDQYAAEHLVGVAAATVRDVARMQSTAEADGKRLLTFTLETEVRFAEPGDVHRFTNALTEAVRQVVEEFDTAAGRPYRLIAGGHPAPRRTEGES